MTSTTVVARGRRVWTEDMMEERLKTLPKICTHCGSRDGHKFLQMANGKTNQPRYKCKTCERLFTHNGKAHKSRHGQLTVRDRVIKKTSRLRIMDLQQEGAGSQDMTALFVDFRARWMHLPPVYIDGVKTMTEAEKMVADETEEDYCYVEEYFDEDGNYVEEFVYVEYE